MFADSFLQRNSDNFPLLLGFVLVILGEEMFLCHFFLCSLFLL